MAEASDFKFGMQRRYAKTHHQIAPRKKWLWSSAGELPDIWRFPLNNYGMAETSDLQFGTQVQCGKAHYKIPPEEKWSWPSARRAPKIWGFPLIVLQ